MNFKSDRPRNDDIRERTTSLPLSLGIAISDVQPVDFVARVVCSKGQRVFVYGTLKRGEPNHKLLADSRNGAATFVGLARTSEKWPLVIASQFNIPFLLNAKEKGNIVLGEIYDVDDSMLTALDVLESHPRLYERVQRDVDLIDPGDQMPDVDRCFTPIRLTCWIYFLQKYKSEMLELPHLDNYSSRGHHGLQYVERDDLEDRDAI